MLQGREVLINYPRYHPNSSPNFANQNCGGRFYRLCLPIGRRQRLSYDYGGSRISTIILILRSFLVRRSFSEGGSEGG